MADYPVPGYSHLATSRPQGTNLAGGQIDVAGVSRQLLGILDRVGAALGKTVVIFSGHRTDAYSAAVGGFKGDPHTLGIATDATIDGQPIGSFPGAVALIHKLGARSGATDFQYKGQADPAHVDLVGSRGATTNAAAATGSSIDSPDTFWYAVETKLGLPHDRTTHQRLQGWANIENTKAAFNPLATTLRQPGSSGLSGNPDGVQNYPTPEAGVQATADTIRKYPTILSVLKGKASPYGNSAFNRELNIWSGNRDKGAAVTPYVRGYLLQIQGNPSSKSAADWFSYDLSNAYKDSGAKAAVDAALAVPRFLGKITDPHNILRGLQIIAGAVLVLVGVVLLTRQVALAADVPTPNVPVPVPIP